MPSSYVCEYAKFCSGYNNESMKCQFLYKFCPLKKDFQEEDKRLKEFKESELLERQAERLRAIDSMLEMTVENNSKLNGGSNG